MDLQIVSQSELEAVEGGFNLTAARRYVAVSVLPQPPGGPVELNPQPLPPREMGQIARMFNVQFA